MGKTKAEKQKAEEKFWYTNNVAYNDKQNKISDKSVQAQLAAAPPPGKPGKSGYPHEYHNKATYPNEPLFRTRTNSSTTQRFEYPAMASGHNYKHDGKPKEDPGPMRMITNQNKTFKGVICHDGVKGTKGTKKTKGEPDNPNGGLFHRAKNTPFK